jgi:DNA-binding beta-propeller fold protein YncE
VFCLQKSCWRGCRFSTVSIFQRPTQKVRHRSRQSNQARQYKAIKQIRQDKASKLANTKQSSKHANTKQSSSPRQSKQARQYKASKLANTKQSSSPRQSKQARQYKAIKTLMKQWRMGFPISLLFFAQIWFLCSAHNNSSPSPLPLSSHQPSPVILFHANNTSSKSLHLKKYSSAPPASRQLTGLSASSEVEVSTLAGTSGSSGSTNGVGPISRFNDPTGVAISADGTYALVADTSNHLIRRIDIATASVSTLAGTSGSSGSTNGVGTISQFNLPCGVAISADGTYALVADYVNHLIRRINIATASVSTLAGTSGSSGSTNGVGTISQFYNPTGVALSADGTYALVADYVNHLIRRIDMTTASVSTFAGTSGSSGSTNGVGTISQFRNPTGVAISADGTYALVADRYNHLIRRINIATASVSTFAGTSGSSGSTNGVGTISQFNRPTGVSISADGTYALVADRDNHLIRRIGSAVSPSSVPSLSPSSEPSVFPTSLPSIPSPTLFGFSVKIGDEAILSSGKAILVDYLRDAKRGEIFPSIPSHSLLLTSLYRFRTLCFLFQARCFLSPASSTPPESPQLLTLPCPLIPFSSSGVPCQQCRGSDLGNPAATRSSAFLLEEYWCRGL